MVKSATTWAAALLILALGGAGTAQAAEKTGAEIQECMRGNLPEETSVQTLAFETRNRLDEVTEARIKLYWKRFEGDLSNVMLRFEAPLERRGSALLMLETKKRTDMFMYLPDLKKVRRVTSRMMEGSMFGTDFTFEEFERLQGLAHDLSVKRLPDQELAGRTVHVLEHTPRVEEGETPERILSYVDPENCVTLRTDFFEQAEEPRKILEADPSSVSQEKGIWIARRMTMRDLREQTQTEVKVEEIDVGARISRKIFSQAGLASGR